MICKRCGKNNAEIYYKQTVNGHTQEYALCSKCAEELKKEGKLNIKMPSLFDESYFGFGSDSLFGDPMLFGLPFESAKKPQLTEKKKCTLCSSTFDDLVKEGRVGCAECYKVFGEELRRSVEGIHGKAKYVGRKPKRFKAKDSKQDKIKALKAELKAAVKAQEFEKAAVLRDEIRSLESGI